MASSGPPEMEEKHKKALNYGYMIEFVKEYDQGKFSRIYEGVIGINELDKVANSVQTGFPHRNATTDLLTDTTHLASSRCAIKYIKFSEEEAKLVKDRTEVHKKVMHHLNIVGIRHVVWFEDNSVAIIMELAQYGSLKTFFEKLKKKDKPLKQEQFTRIANEMIDGLKELHRHKRVHCNVSADNILMFREYPRQGEELTMLHPKWTGFSHVVMFEKIDAKNENEKLKKLDEKKRQDLDDLLKILRWMTPIVKFDDKDSEKSIMDKFRDTLGKLQNIFLGTGTDEKSQK